MYISFYFRYSFPVWMSGELDLAAGTTGTTPRPGDLETFGSHRSHSEHCDPGGGTLATSSAMWNHLRLYTIHDFTRKHITNLQKYTILVACIVAYYRDMMSWYQLVDYLSISQSYSLISCLGRERDQVRGGCWHQALELASLAFSQARFFFRSRSGNEGWGVLKGDPIS